VTALHIDYPLQGGIARKCRGDLLSGRSRAIQAQADNFKINLASIANVT
jgi:hypothetical protein